MKTASKLLTAAFALAAIASVAMPTAQPAHAASGPDLKVGLDYNDSNGGNVMIAAWVHNFGNTDSQAVNITASCGYLDEFNSVKWVAQGLPTIRPSIAASGGYTMPTFFCQKVNGNHPIAARITALTSGDLNPADNDLKVQTFVLK